jgi:hypothetical protein
MTRDLTAEYHAALVEHCDDICLDYNEIGTDLWLDCGCIDPDDDDSDPGWADGDHDSSMTSIGWGTDEDYGYYGGDDW